MAPTIPTATYRLQLTPRFGFDDAAAIVPYLKALGTSHLYASPFLKARAGTTHGYDIIDHNALNPEFGGEDAFIRLSDALKDAGLGLILDFVPNHMAVHDADNAWWLDVLEWGPRSPYAAFFDIDWDAEAGRQRVLLPILGRSYGEALEGGEIALRYDANEGSFSAWYYQHRMPIAPERYGEIIQKAVASAGAADQPAGHRLIALAAAFRGPRNPPRDTAPELKRALAAIAGARDIIERGLVAYQPKSDWPGATIALHYLLERQHYRPAFWRLAGSDINYRRFFDINTLAGLRMEYTAAFNAIHPLVLRLIGEGRLQGLRLDHIDGLQDPHQYLRRLQRRIPAPLRSFYIVVEKILAEDERLPPLPGVAGTTGYEWLNIISRVLLDERGLKSLDEAWRAVSGGDPGFDAIVRQAKHRVLSTILLSEFTVLARLLARIAAGHYSTRDYTADRLREALELFILNFTVYRTYITSAGPSPEDRAIIKAAIDRSRAEWFGSDADIFDFLSDALTLDLIRPGHAGHSIPRVRRFAFKLQQFTGPMMAKSLEDTAFYRYHRLIALNEVGGDPAADGLSVDQFHDLMQRRMAEAPHGLTATATHDTKRGEDARARLLALTEFADEWRRHVDEWRRMTAALRTNRDPTPAHEYLVYQALLGAWPLAGIDESFVERMEAYVIKAAREGKEQTSWILPEEKYEARLKNLIRGLLDEKRSAPFIRSFDAFARRVALVGALNSLSQTTLKFTMPGVPDLYQGTEFWDLSLVDPDNRRPVDFEARKAALQIDRPDWAALAAGWMDGRIKLALTQTLLGLRQRLPALFAEGVYQPIEVSGPHRDEITAYARVHGSDAVIVVVARHFGRATQGGTMWPDRRNWDASLRLDRFQSVRDAIGERSLPAGNQAAIADLFTPLPIAAMTAKVVRNATLQGDTRGPG